MTSNRLLELTFYISLIVVITLAISFSVLFTLYSFYKRKHIKYGHEDNKILEELKKKYHYPVNKGNDILPNNENIKLSEEINKSNKKYKGLSILSKIISSLFLLLILGIGVFVIVFKANNDNLFINNTTYLVIQTGSMEKINDSNKYLKENNLNNQINQYSMIGITKVDSKDINLYDVIAFKNSDGDTIVHRVISINEDINNNTLTFTTRGDSNSNSFNYEINIKEEDILGKYNGFNNFPLGVFTIYLKSTSGIVAICSTLIFFISFEVSEELIDKEYKIRKLVVADNFDNLNSNNDLNEEEE